MTPTAYKLNDSQTEKTRRKRKLRQLEAAMTEVFKKHHAGEAVGAGRVVGSKHDAGTCGSDADSKNDSV